jgi:hypothetical protein
MITATIRYYGATRSRRAFVEATAVWEADGFQQETITVPADDLMRGAKPVALKKLMARLRARGLAGKKLTVHYR